MTPYVVDLSAPSPLFDYRPYRESDAAIGWNASYTESAVWPSIPPNNSQPHIEVPGLGFAYRRTRLNGASVSVSFEGLGFYVCFTAGGATYELTLNGSATDAARSAAGSACKKSGAESFIAVDGLSVGTHDAVLTVTSQPADEFRFFGGGVTLGLGTNGFEVDDSMIIDDLDKGWKFSPRSEPRATWDLHRGPSYFDNTLTFNCLYGPQYTATYTVTDSVGVVLNSALGWNDHAFSITFDDVVYNMDTTSHWLDNNTIFFAKGNLNPTASYDLTIASYSSDVPNCQSIDEFGQPVNRLCCISIDSVTLLKASTSLLTSTTTSATTSTSGTTTSSTATATQHSGTSLPLIVGSALGGLFLALALVAVGVCVFLRRRRKHLGTAAGVYQPAGLATDTTLSPYFPARPRYAANTESSKPRLFSHGSKVSSTPPSSSSGAIDSNGVALTDEVVRRVLDHLALRSEPAISQRDGRPPQYSE
ncbi:hypothetical protein EXIGLDRAFT_769888 [Exidia glandulosa HHB12029]|uniref:Transmembrane protein n=1 Tax=Exidia glandulosa HHB12029 TaxID=1314781 RepID=A0A165H4L2_EXIGL|nr:hypothetical protein EXIGLDRAFT_769888 [Exidia glandulosa HHB12029]